VKAIRRDRPLDEPRDFLSHHERLGFVAKLRELDKLARQCCGDFDDQSFPGLPVEIAALDKLRLFGWFLTCFPYCPASSTIHYQIPTFCNNGL
jgi:hypothetical protein